MKARIPIGGREVTIDLSAPLVIARDLNFDATQPRHFGAPAATTHAFSVPGFSGSVATGASCNCNIITLIPHCNGTHTECVGHLTSERLDAHRVAPKGLIPAVLMTIEPTDDTPESTDPAPQPGDKLITRAALERNWPADFQPQAVIIRTTDSSYLSRDAAEFLVARDIEHLVVDLPSIDRAQDEGRLTAHRIFFGLAPDATTSSSAARPQATVTELAQIPADIPDGLYLLEIQVPAIAGDAVPSRPLLYPL